MGNRLPHGLEGRGHWLDMLGGGGEERQLSLLLMRTEICYASLRLH
jgi:hypothetical protein